MKLYMRETVPWTGKGETQEVVRAGPGAEERERRDAVGPRGRHGQTALKRRSPLAGGDLGIVALAHLPSTPYQPRYPSLGCSHVAGPHGVPTSAASGDGGPPPCQACTLPE